MSTLFFLTLFNNKIYGQADTSKKDIKRTIISVADSLIFFHHSTPTENNNEMKGLKNRKNGFVINSITVEVLSPAGRDILDTSKHRNPKYWGKFVNRTHINTKKIVVRQLILFKENDTIEKLDITESERLLRRNLKIRDARILITPSKTSPGKYDVAVLIQDLGSLNFGINNANGLNSYAILERNLFGYGSTAQAAVNYNKKEYDSYSLFYEDPSVYNTYVDLSVSYSTADSNYTNGARVNKNFSSGLFQWAGGGGYLNKNLNRYFYNGATVIGDYNSSLKQTDVWVGKSFRLKFIEDKADNSIKDFVITARYINQFEQNKKILIPDSIPFNLLNRTSNKILFSYGLTYRRYYKDSYIFRFKYSEDIPEGFMFSILTGKSFNKYYPDNYYVGCTAGLANNNRFGYFNATLQYVKSYSPYMLFNNAVSSLKLFYLSPLLLKKKYKDRLIVTANFREIGNDVAFDRLSIGNNDGFLNVNTRSISGLTKTSFIFNNIMYTPFKPFGFYVGFFAYAAFANLSPIQDITIGSKWYQSFGVGLLLRNEGLLVNSIRISFSFYPGFPSSNYKFNPIWIYDLQVPEMTINQPEYELQY